MKNTTPAKTGSGQTEQKLKKESLKSKTVLRTAAPRPDWSRFWLDGRVQGRLAERHAQVTDWSRALQHLLVRKTCLLRHLNLKTIILLRQTRDRHRKNSKQDAFFAGRRMGAGALAAATRRAGKNTHMIFCENEWYRFILNKMIILPRQARDKHRESTQQKEMRSHIATTASRWKSSRRRAKQRAAW
jgi:hypothetical protein